MQGYCFHCNKIGKGSTNLFSFLSLTNIPKRYYSGFF